MTFLFIFFLALLVFFQYEKFRVWHNQEASEKLPSRISVTIPAIVIGVFFITSTMLVTDYMITKDLTASLAKVKKAAKPLVFSEASSYPNFLKIIKPDTISRLIDAPKGIHKRLNTRALVIHGTAGTGLDNITNYHHDKWGHQGYHILILKTGKISCPVDPNSLTVSYGINPGTIIDKEKDLYLSNANTLHLAFETSFAPSSNVFLTSSQIDSYSEVWRQIKLRYPWIIITFHKDVNNTLCPNVNDEVRTTLLHISN